MRKQGGSNRMREGDFVGASLNGDCAVDSSRLLKLKESRRFREVICAAL